MKKLYLLAAGTVFALGANAADYTVASPYVDQSVTEGETKIFDVIVASDNVIDGLTQAGQKVNDWRVNDTDKFLYVWENTFTGGSSEYPGVGYSGEQTDGYASLNVGNVGWSGAGYNFAAPGVSTKHWSDETRIHIAYRTTGTAPASVGFGIVADNGVPARVAVGASMNDQGNPFPSVGPEAANEWTAIDLSFAELKTLSPAFTYMKSDSWSGNILTFLAGGVAGRNICLDAIYFYTPAGDDEGDEGGEGEGGEGGDVTGPYQAATPYADFSVVADEEQIFDVVLANDYVIDGLKAAGQTVNDWRLNDTDRNLYIWDNTYQTGSTNGYGVGYMDVAETHDYVSFNVGNVGWSGAGFNISVAGPVSTAHWTEETTVHIAYRTDGEAPASVAFVIGDKDGNNTPAKVAVGSNFNDGGVIYPSIGLVPAEDWQAIYISFSDLKTLYPTFDYQAVSGWSGNILAFLGGGVAGKNICLDAIYFHTPTGTSGISAAQDELTLNGSHITANGAIAVYDLSGRKVTEAADNLDISTLGGGIYIVKAGNAVKKIIK